MRQAPEGAWAEEFERRQEAVQLASQNGRGAMSTEQVTFFFCFGIRVFQIGKMGESCSDCAIEVVVVTSTLTAGCPEWSRGHEH